MANRTRSFNKTHATDVSKSPPSKNLAHVPCKFFKHGACQAGNSCPFSHQLDQSADTTPCKYFQKGNCKFGVKCALAHILPDGRRVNPKSLAQVYQNHNLTNGHKATNGTAEHSEHRVSQSQQQQKQQHQATTPSKMISPRSDKGNATTNTVSMRNQNGTSPQYSHLNGHAHISPTQTSVGSLPSEAIPFKQQESLTQPMRPFSSADKTSNSPFGSATIWSTAGANMRSMSYSAGVSNVQLSSYPSFRHESAIADDDDDGLDDMFEEDFVPSSLSDLLTPQERQRRGSRNSGTMTRPVLLDKPNTAQVILDEDDDTNEEDTQFQMDDDAFSFTNARIRDINLHA